MKRVLTVAAVITLALAGVASAQTTADLSVTASVAANCTIATNALAFGAYDPFSATDHTGTGGVVVTCTKGSVPTIGLGPGLHQAAANRQMANGTELLGYLLYQPDNSTLWGNTTFFGDPYTAAAAPDMNARTFTIYGVIPAGQDVATGNYADTVVATVNF